MAVGLIPVYSLGAILPDVEDKEALKNDERWRVIWLGPALIGSIIILLTLTVFRLEPVFFCAMENRDEEGIAHLRKVYRKAPGINEPLDDLLKKRYAELKSSTTLDASTTSFRQALCGSKYRRGTFITLMIMFFNQQSGFSVIVIYANQLIQQMREQSEAEGSEFPLNPIEATYFMGVSNAIAAALPLLYIGRVGRRPIFVIG